MQNFESVCVIGLGYIGLPTASLLATKGLKVLGCDVNPKVVETINRGDVHIVEKDLDILVRSAVMSGQLSAALEPQSADVYIIAVPTPFKENHKPDISYVQAATTALARHITPGSLIILESTSPVGTTDNIAAWLKSLRPDLIVGEQIYIAHCPERVLPGHILKELVENDRIIGGINAASSAKAQAFYQIFVQGEILVTDAKTAEMSKLTENAFRDVNIAFANELSIVCSALKINVWELIRLANHHPRVNILQPGPGVGGHCIAVDPWFIVDAAPDKTPLIQAARAVNNQKPKLIVEEVINHAVRIKNPVLACLGLAFKANIDDLRESPAVEITKDIADRNIGQLLVVEPHVNALPSCLCDLEPEVQLVNIETALDRADIVLLLVDHKQFTTINKDLLAKKIVIDTRGLWEKNKEAQP